MRREDLVELDRLPEQTWKGSYMHCDQGTVKKSAWSEGAQERTEALCEPCVLATCLSVHSGGKFGRPWWWKEIDGRAGGTPERQAAFQSLLAKIAEGEDEKTPCFREIFIKKQNKTLSNGLFECTSLARKQPMISENCIITLCLLIFFPPYLITIWSSICLFKDMWENREGYRGQSKNCILLPGFPELTVQLFVFDEITMKIELFKANAVQISCSQSSLPQSHGWLLPPNTEDLPPP